MCAEHEPRSEADLQGKSAAELVCKPCKLAFPVRDDIPVMLQDEARQLAAEEA